MTQSLDITALNAAYKAGTLRPEDVIADVYRRIAAEGTRPIWITLRPEADAIAQARNAPKGPLYGIPFAVKDNIDAAGLPTTCACPEFAYVPERSSFVVELLEAAGAILIGKTNLDQFATGLNGTRSPYGVPSSAFDPAYISGGSSSGSAVAVAKGLVSFALGTDTAGSGRVPAAFNNLVGWKPTKGVISTRGVVPACRAQDAVSIFALTVADAAAIADVAGIYDPQDAFARKAPAAQADSTWSAPLRIGIPKSLVAMSSGAYTQILFDESVERARSIGASIHEIDYAPFAEAASLLYSGAFVAERLAAIEDFAEAKPEALYEPVRSIILGARQHTAAAAFKSLYKLAGLTRTAEAQWAHMDMLLLPTAGAAYSIADMLADPVRLNTNLGAYTNFVNLMDLSAIAIPAGFRADGIPFGVTLIGPAFQERRIAEFADKLHRAVFGTARLGATETPLMTTPKLAAAVPLHTRIRVAVVGAHLSGEPLNGQLTARDARLVGAAHTSPGYSFYALTGTAPLKPGLVYDGKGAGGIEVEIWEMDEDRFGSFVALIPAPLGIGTLRLADGTTVKGFLCEAHAVEGAEDITHYGGWRAWRRARAS